MHLEMCILRTSKKELVPSERLLNTNKQTSQVWQPQITRLPSSPEGHPIGANEGS